ncbi:MAG: peptidoglycan D,D-transpeptidase FtsI family protein, partial [Actinomycetes bacterium]
VGAFVALMVLLPVGRLGAMQVYDSKELARDGRHQRIRETSVTGYRGAIIDRNGADLAVSVATRTVSVNMKNLRLRRGVYRTELARRLASRLGLETADVVRRMNSADDLDPVVFLGRNLRPSRVAATQKMLLGEDMATWFAGIPNSERIPLPTMPGRRHTYVKSLGNLLVVMDTIRRINPAVDSGMQLIGKLPATGRPGRSAGLESYLDPQLRGSDGVRRSEVGIGGATIPGTERSVSAPKPGSDVQLTLDRSLQYQAEEILKQALASTKAKQATAIIGTPNDGEVLAIASVQKRDDGQIGVSVAPFATDFAYQAGSVFKLVTIAAATEANLVHADTKFAVPYQIRVADRTFSDHDKHGVLTMTTREILAKSSNVGTIKIAQQLTRSQLYGAMRNFGFGERTNVGSPNESRGLLPPVEEWTAPDHAATSIGTHVGATPVQIWAAYNVIANQGRYVSPRLVDAVIDPSGRRHVRPQARSRRVVSPATAREMTDSLQAVAEIGTAKHVRISGYPVAAKTGTSRMPSPKRVDKKDGYKWADGVYHYVTTFTGFLPADRPQLSITVLIADAPSGSSGATTAGPVFAQLAQLAIRKLGIAPTAAYDVNAEGDDTGLVRAAPATAATVSGGSSGASRRKRSTNGSTSRSTAGGAVNGAGTTGATGGSASYGSTSATIAGTDSGRTGSSSSGTG